MFKVGRLLVLLIGITSLAGYYLYSEYHAKTASRETFAARKILVTTPGDDVLRLSIQKRDKRALAMTRRGAEWWLEQPLEYKADALIVNGLVSAIKHTTWERSFAISDLTPEEVGLKDPENRIGIMLQSAPDKMRFLLLGKEAQVSNLFYAMWEDGNEIFMLHAQFARAFDKSLFAVRNKRVFSSQPEQVVAVKAMFGQDVLRLSKQDDGWQWKGEEQMPADSNKVQEYLLDVTGLYVKEFLDDINADNPDLGLVQRENTIVIATQSGVKEILWIGNENKDNQAYYAKREHKPTVFLIDKRRLPKLPKQDDFKIEIKEEVVQQETDEEEIAAEEPAVSLPEVEDEVFVESLSRQSIVEREQHSIDAIELGAETTLAAVESPERLKSRFNKIFMRKLGTRVTLVKQAQVWTFEESEASMPIELSREGEGLVAYIEELELGERALGQDKPKVPYAISVQLFSGTDETESYTFYKKGGSILAESTRQPGLYLVNNQVWTDLDQTLRDILSYKKYAA